VLHGDADDRVPQRQSLDYARVAEAAGDDVRLVAFTGMGHFELIDPAHESWHVTTAELAAAAARPS
jgi:dipeptidyl aminopeptidase/acylaminoacyl peptidase